MLIRQRDDYQRRLLRATQPFHHSRIRDRYRPFTVRRYETRGKVSRQRLNAKNVETRRGQNKRRRQTNETSRDPNTAFPPLSSRAGSGAPSGHRPKPNRASSSFPICGGILNAQSKEKTASPTVAPPFGRDGKRTRGDSDAKQKQAFHAAGKPGISGGRQRAKRKALTFDADGVQVEELAGPLGPVGLLGKQDGVVRRVHPRCRCAVTAGHHHGYNEAPFRPKRHTHTGTTQHETLTPGNNPSRASLSRKHSHRGRLNPTLLPPPPPPPLPALSFPRKPT